MTQADSARGEDDLLRHGGRLDTAMLRWPHAPRPWLDLSTGINPVAWEPSAELVIDAGPLPDRRALAGLEAAAARFFGVSPVNVAAVPGSEIALRLLSSLGLPQPLVAAAPGYGTHRDVAAAQEPVASLVQGSGRAATLLLANPANPDGRIWTPEQLLRLAATQAGAGGWLVVDEAFADAGPDASVLPHLAEDMSVLVLRSFGKFFGLAGVRLGFAVGPSSVLDRMRALFGDWPVSAQAIAWGTAAYMDADWVAATRMRLHDDAVRLAALLARHGMQAHGGCPLFRLVEHPHAWEVFTRLARSGILTRPFADRTDWLRFGLPPGHADLDRLDRALSVG